MRTIALGIALLTITSTALASHDEPRRTTKTSGAIAWSTRDRDGNKLSVVFQFGDRTSVGLRYEADRYGRYDRYDRDDRYDRYGRNDRYDRDDHCCPPVYDYSRWRGRDYDRQYFSCYEEWSDWQQWQKRWSKRKGWQHDHRERDRAWDAFCHEREMAYARWERSHRYENDRRRRGHHDDD